MHLRLLLIVAMLLPFAAPAIAQSSPADADLVYVLTFSRHGVRSPTGKSSQYDKFSAAPWPIWSVEPGYLTPHGYTLMKNFGAADLATFATEGLFQSNGCADAAHITVHADSDQRTRETAKALAEGMFPGCNVPVHALDEGTNDPLFHAAPGSIPPTQSALAKAEVLARVGNDPTNIATAYHAQLAALDNILATCGAKTADHPRTSIFDVPATIDPGNGDHAVEMKGPLNTAGTLTENFLLAYADGKENNDVAWGCLDAAKLRTLIDLHTASFDIAQRTRAVALPQAAALLRGIDRSLEQAAIGKPVPGALDKPGNKALLLVGHDTNLANLAGALNLDWLVDGRRNDTPPGSTLIFELWRAHKTGRYTIRVRFTAQTLEQMRTASTDTPPSVPVFIPACSLADGACDVAAFHKLLESLTPTR